MVDFTVSINGVSISKWIERDSYVTSSVPVFTETVTTMDFVDHAKIGRWKGALSFSLNPMSAADTITFATALKSAMPATVIYKDLDTGNQKTATMRLDGTSVSHLSRCLYLNTAWRQREPLQFTEM